MQNRITNQLNLPLKVLILFGLLISTGLLNAQTDFRPGYIITNSEDTVYGNIDYRGDILMSTVCKFKDAENKIYTYAPNEIKAYRFFDSKYYISKEIEGTQYFLEYLLNGEVSIYYMRDGSDEQYGDHYYIDKEDLAIIELPYEKGVRHAEGTEFFYETTRHVGVLYVAMQDAPEFLSRIQSIKVPNHKNLIKLAEDYHSTVCDGEKCIIYTREASPFKISIEPTIGVNITIDGIDDYKERFLNREIGAYIYLWLPRSNENLYFRTGLINYKSIEDNVDLNYITIPLQVQYIYRAHNLQPHISTGLNLMFSEYGFMPFLGLNAGLNYKLSNKFYLSTGLNSGFKRLESYRLNLISYTTYIGFRIDF